MKLNRMSLFTANVDDRAHSTHTDLYRIYGIPYIGIETICVTYLELTDLFT